MSIRIIFDEALLEFNDDQRIYNGNPFTGVAYEEYPNGILKREITYKDGFENGLCRDWYPSGQLKCEWNALRGRAKGKLTKWHENGTIKAISEHDFGLELKYQEWTSDGQLVTARQIDTNSNLYKNMIELDRRQRLLQDQSGLS
jgi:antitoxin component YwqK of YwqJK toxin-antitoxin module